MKKVLLTLSALFLGASSVYGAPLGTCNLRSAYELTALLGNSCIDDDKEYEFTSFTNLGDPAVSAGQLDVIIDSDQNDPVTGDRHFINFTSDAGAFTAGQSFQIAYTIRVLDPTKRIYRASMDANAPDGNVNTTKQLTIDNNMAQMYNLSSSGAPDFTLINPAATEIDVVLTATVLPGGTLFGVSDTYRQSPIPEPGTYALMGAGLVALAAIRRRK